ncbi:hypothetical protein BJX61DRAFT_182280 [Aspergillus egyptiacus]|nr:hypothetical protein BJX61DRAFT_182280 [Aspergillus egyptiacus]
MSSDSGVQFIARGRKRPREPPASPPAQSSSSTLNNTLPPLTLPSVRYAGDGLDFRRPITSPAPPEEEEVIDLTNEPDSPELSRALETSSHRPRGPRFSRETAADVVDLEEEHPDPPSSPEVQFISSNVRERRPPPPPRAQGFMDSTFFRMLPLPHTTIFRPTARPYRREIPWREAAPLSRAELETLWIGEATAGAVDLTINLDVEDPYVEFLGTTAGGGARTGRPRDSYKPPSPAPEGFARTITEDDIATCPNCDEELGVGDDIKQQIWVAKQCGHVYCGECAKNRSLTKSKKTTSKTKPFARCQVSECGKSVSAPRAMFQIYL